jgi:hypothetical protein
MIVNIKSGVDPLFLFLTKGPFILAKFKKNKLWHRISDLS